MFDGLICQAIGDDSVDIDMPLVTAPVELAIGKFAMDIKTVDYEGVQGDFSLIQAHRLPLLWQLGPTLLFQEPLSRLQVASIYLRGPNYTGNFQAESPLADLPTLACDVLRRCDITSVPVDDYIKLLGFQGLESVVDPAVDTSSGTVATPTPGSTPTSLTFELPPVPPPLLAYSAVHTSLCQLTQEEMQNVIGKQYRSYDDPSVRVLYGLYVCIHACMHCMYVCMYVCVDALMCVFIPSNPLIIIDDD